MGMNTDRGVTVLFYQKLLYPFKNGPNLMGQGSAIGVAEYQSFRSTSDSTAQGSQAVLAIFLEPVKKMFCIVDQVFHPGAKVSQGIFNDLQIVFQFNAQGIVHMDIPALAENCDGRSFSSQHSLQVGILFRRILKMTG